MVATILEYFYSIITILSLCFVINRSLKNRAKSTYNWFWFGFIYTFVCSSLLYTTYPINWISSKIFQIIGITLIIIIFSIVSAFLYSLVGIIFKKNINLWKELLFFSFALFILDIVRSLIFSILFYGGSGSIGLNFDVTSLGHSLSITPLVEFSYFGGTYFLTFILSVVVFSIVSYKKLKHFFIIPFIILIGLVFVHFLPNHNFSNPVKIAIITTNFKDTEDLKKVDEEKGSRFLQLEKMTYSLSEYQPDIIVYPEDARFIRYLNEEKLQILRKTFPKTLFIDGDTRLLNDKFSNLSLFYETKGNDSGKNDENISARGKTFLFPFSEYTPILFKPFLSIFMSKDEYGLYKSNHTYTSMNTFGSYLFNKESIVTLICSELFSYSSLKKLSTSDPSIVFFQSNLSVFHNNPWFNMHLRAFTKIAASTIRSIIISSSNGSDSYIISPVGTIIKEIPIGFFTTKIELTGNKVIIDN